MSNVKVSQYRGQVVEIGNRQQVGKAGDKALYQYDVFVGGGKVGHIEAFAYESYRMSGRLAYGNSVSIKWAAHPAIPSEYIYNPYRLPSKSRAAAADDVVQQYFEHHARMAKRA